MPNATTTELSDFLDYFWGLEIPGGGSGFVYLPTKTEGEWKSWMFKWPKGKQGVIDHILKWSALGSDVYFAPSLFKSASPKKDQVLGSWVLWVDLDGNAPDAWPKADIPEPTLIVQSSEDGHEHCYWRLDRFISDVKMLEERNRALAYALDADQSGWDADQVLRPVGTTNYKRGLPVFILQWER